MSFTTTLEKLLKTFKTFLSDSELRYQITSASGVGRIYGTGVGVCRSHKRNSTDLKVGQESPFPILHNNMTVYHQHAID